MDTKALEKFAQNARRQLQQQVTARLDRVLQTDTGELRARSQAVTDLQKAIKASSRQAVIEQVAYTWFNRFCALRYMDANHYTRIGIVSPAVGFTQPEILQEAKQGVIDPDLPLDQQRIFDLLGGRTVAADPQQEAYRLLLVAACNYYHDAMPFLFEKIDDYTELLMPDDLLSENSVLHAAREVLTEEACQDVEVIGWLYQFYISEKKDAVIGAKKAITPENIPAATQLFTPHWIVRYLVENSLGRLWLLNRPHSRLAERMEFYIEPQTSEVSETSEVLQINSPEELTLCDPAVGSAHMLTYAFELLYAIYEEEGYNAPDIPRLILEKNLVGLEIDERAGALAAFALVMKARAYDRRFFKRESSPAITVLHPIALLTEAELDAEVAALVPALAGSWQEEPQQMALLATGQKQMTLTEASGMQMLREALRHDLNLFREADNFGSLLRPMLSAAQLTRLRDHLTTAAPTGQLQLFDQNRRKKVLQAITQAIPLARHYAVVIANPPYMGSKNQNVTLKKFLNDGYKNVKADLFSAFTVRIMEMTCKDGFIGMMTPFTWMFLSSYEKLRHHILGEATLTSLIRPEYHAFFDSAFVPICGFTLYSKSLPDYKGAFIDLQEFYGADVQPVKALEAIQNPDCGYFHRAAATDFKKIPGSPIAYRASPQVREIFASSKRLDEIAEPRQGLATTDNNLFTRLWFEIPYKKIGFGMRSRDEALQSRKGWFPFNKGGQFRKWYGNNEFLVNWEEDGKAIKETIVKKYPYLNGNPDFVAKNPSKYFKAGITWGAISSSNLSVRWDDIGFIPSNAGMKLYQPDYLIRQTILGLMNSYVIRELVSCLSETINFDQGIIARIPYVSVSGAGETTERLIRKAKSDWNSFENSWDFTTLPLLQSTQSQVTLAATYATLFQQWQEKTLEMQRLEEENNRLFITAYGLQDELTPDVPLSEITLTCNPHYRYSGNKTEEALEALILADTLREFISYAVGCMFGRYSLDKPGLILANQGETAEEYRRIVNSELSFPPDEDNAIPMLDGNWFPDDITERFKKFLRVTFGETHYEENLAFIEAAIGRDIRSYFLRDFYDHHMKMYKKRPIYWLFSSAKGSFNCLIYMHRYRPDTISIILNDYLREFRAKLNAHKSHLQQVERSAATPQGDKTRALKEIGTIDKTLAELREYEDDILYPLATQKIQIDLDDGVLVNYNKFDSALKKVTGLSEK